MTYCNWSFTQVEYKNLCLWDCSYTFLLFPVDTGRKRNVHKTFRRRPGCLLNVLCTFNLRHVYVQFTSCYYFYQVFNFAFIEPNFLDFNYVAIFPRSFKCRFYMVRMFMKKKKKWVRRPNKGLTIHESLESNWYIPELYWNYDATFTSHMQLWVCFALVKHLLPPNLSIANSIFQKQPFRRVF